MRKLRIYLDTSVISFLYAEDAPDFRKITLDFFNHHFSKYAMFISTIVLFELNNTKDATERSRLLKIVATYPFNVINIEGDQAVNHLAELYIAEKIIPVNKKEDALHVAVSTVHGMDILLSWNFKHLANIKKQRQINSLNEREGYYKRLNLLSPLEVEYDD
jgi:hypothetical protein